MRSYRMHRRHRRVDFNPAGRNFRVGRLVLHDGLSIQGPVVGGGSTPTTRIGRGGKSTFRGHRIAGIRFRSCGLGESTDPTWYGSRPAFGPCGDVREARPNRNPPSAGTHVGAAPVRGDSGRGRARSLESSGNGAQSPTAARNSSESSLPMAPERVREFRARRIMGPRSAGAVDRVVDGYHCTKRGVRLYC